MLSISQNSVGKQTSYVIQPASMPCSSYLFCTQNCMDPYASMYATATREGPIYGNTFSNGWCAKHSSTQTTLVPECCFIYSPTWAGKGSAAALQYTLCTSYPGLCCKLPVSAIHVCCQRPDDSVEELHHWQSLMAWGTALRRLDVMFLSPNHPTVHPST